MSFLTYFIRRSDQAIVPVRDCVYLGYVPIRFAIMLVAFLCALTCALMGTATVYKIVDEVNKLLPAEQHFSTYWWYWAKYERLNREYKRLYPEGRLWKRFRICTALMFAFGLVAAWGIGLY